MLSHAGRGEMFGLDVVEPHEALRGGDGRRGDSATVVRTTGIPVRS